MSQPPLFSRFSINIASLTIVRWIIHQLFKIILEHFKIHSAVYLCQISGYIDSVGNSPVEKVAKPPWIPLHSCVFAFYLVEKGIYQEIHTRLVAARVNGFEFGFFTLKPLLQNLVHHWNTTFCWKISIPTDIYAVGAKVFHPDIIVKQNIV